MLYADFVDSLSDDPDALRELYELAEDREGLAQLGRRVMGQGRTIVTDR